MSTPKQTPGTNQPLVGRIAVVTGAGRGLGQHVALGLAAAGARVAAIARSKDQVEQTVQRIRSAGGESIGLTADVAQIEAVDNVRGAVERELGAAGILVNAAGVFGPIQLVAESDPDRWIETIATNTIGPYLMCRAFVPDMVAGKWGRIINFSSAAALHTPGPLNSAYGTSKVALNHFTRHLAAELAGTNVTVNAIHPGEARTEMWRAIQQESQATGALGAGYREWAAHVDQTGGDDPQKALDLVLEMILDPSPTSTGKFLWIKGGLQTPIPSW